MATDYRNAFREVNASLDDAIGSVQRASAAAERLLRSQERLCTAVDALVSAARALRDSSERLKAQFQETVPVAPDLGDDVIRH